MRQEEQAEITKEVEHIDHEIIKEEHNVKKRFVKNDTDDDEKTRVSAQFKRIPALSMDSMSQIMPSQDEFYVEYAFSVIQMDTSTGAIG